MRPIMLEIFAALEEAESEYAPESVVPVLQSMYGMV